MTHNRCQNSGARIARQYRLCLPCRQRGVRVPKEEDEPTAEELDKIEAEQRANLPEWWPFEVPHGEGDE